jgi:hypothetical protein
MFSAKATVRAPRHLYGAESAARGHPANVARFLRALGAHKKDLFRRRLVGTEQRALILRQPSAEGCPVGLTGNYQEALVRLGENLVDENSTLVNRFATIRLERPLADGRWEAGLLLMER